MKEGLENAIEPDRSFNYFNLRSLWRNNQQYKIDKTNSINWKSKKRKK